MAIDSEQKRKSAATVGFPVLPPSIVPGGSFTQQDRQHAAWSYTGILSTTDALGQTTCSVASRGLVISGSTTVNTAGKGAVLATRDDCPVVFHSLTIQAKTSNRGKIYIGGRDVDSSTNGGLAAGIRVDLDTEHSRALRLDQIYVDVDVDEEGVDWHGVVA